LIENHHQQGILHHSLAPAPNLTVTLQTAAEGYATLVLEALGYVGVLTIEFFATKSGLLANEMAPRVHNSGHWTIEGAETSQFANHLRAIVGLPLGSPAPVGTCEMINILGSLPHVGDILATPNAYLHLYDKAQRPGRKIGHVTYVRRLVKS
jgi:5-(carboxyamino)imidazole ribonucleotide synthase